MNKIQGDNNRIEIRDSKNNFTKHRILSIDGVSLYVFYNTEDMKNLELYETGGCDCVCVLDFDDFDYLLYCYDGGYIANDSDLEIYKKIKIRNTKIDNIKRNLHNS